MLLRQLALPGMDTFEDPKALDKFLPYMNFVLGFIAFTVGASLYLATLRNTEKRIGLLLLGEALLVPFIVGATMYFIGPMLSNESIVMNRETAILLAAVAIAVR